MPYRPRGRKRRKDALRRTREDIYGQTRNRIRNTIDEEEEDDIARMEEGYGGERTQKTLAYHPAGYGVIDDDYEGGRNNVSDFTAEDGESKLYPGGGEALRMASGLRSSRGFSDSLGGETRLTIKPGPYPRWLPETQTMTHIYNGRITRYLTADGSGNYPLGEGTDIIIKPLDPEGFLNTFTGSTGGSTDTYSSGDLSMYNFMETIYEYFHVLACRVKIEFTDWHVITGDPNIYAVPDNDGDHIWPPKTIFEIHYSSDLPKTINQTTLANSEHNQLLGLRNVKIHHMKDNKQWIHDTHHYWRPQSYVLEKEYTRADYNEIMDITTDAENTIWTAVGGSPTLPFNVSYLPRWKNRAADAASKLNYFTMDLHLEFDIQWKQLKTTLSGGYWNTPTLH